MFQKCSFEINPVILAIKAEQPEIGTRTVDPTACKDREVPMANPLTPNVFSEIVT